MWSVRNAARAWLDLASSAGGTGTERKVWHGDVDLRHLRHNLSFIEERKFEAEDIE